MHAFSFSFFLLFFFNVPGVVVVVVVLVAIDSGFLCGLELNVIVRCGEGDWWVRVNMMDDGI